MGTEVVPQRVKAVRAQNSNHFEEASHAGAQTVPRREEHATNVRTMPELRSSRSGTGRQFLTESRNRITHSQTSRYLPSKSKDGNHQHESPCRVSRLNRQIVGTRNYLIIVRVAGLAVLKCHAMAMRKFPYITNKPHFAGCFDEQRSTAETIYLTDIHVLRC